MDLLQGGRRVKKLALWLLPLSLAAQHYTIQLMSVKSRASFTPYFMKMVKKSGLKYDIVKESGMYKIVLGDFTAKKEAQQAISKLHCLPRDAFVRVLHVKTTQREKRASKKPKRESSVHETLIKSTQKRQRNAPYVTLCSDYPTRKERRKCEIAEAIAFYKKSPCYRFAMK